MEREKKCSLCSSTKAKIFYFSCEHSQCSKCIFRTFFEQQFEVLTEFISSPNETIRILCKSCNSGISVIPFSKFLTIFNEVDPLKKQGQKCSKHGMPLTFYCEQCAQSFCERCADIHDEIGNSHHNLRGFSQNNNSLKDSQNCLNHKSKLTFYCEDCEVPACSFCVQLEHKDHNYVELEPFISSTINSIKNISLNITNTFLQMSLTQFNFNKCYTETYKSTIQKLDRIITLFTHMKRQYIEKMRSMQRKQDQINEILIKAYKKLNSNIISISSQDIDEVLFLRKLYNLSSEINSDLKIAKPKGHCIDNFLSYAGSKVETSASYSNRITSGNLNCSLESAITFLIQHDFKLVRSFNEHKYQVRCVLELPDGKIATGSYKEIKIFDTNTYKCIATLKGHNGYIYLLLNLVNDNFASCGEDETMIIWDNKNYSKVKELRDQNHFEQSLLLLPDGNIASIDENNNINIRNPDSEFNCVDVLSGHEDMITSMILVPKEKIASASLDCTIRIWIKEEYRYQCKYILNEHNGPVNSILFYTNKFSENKMISCSDDGCIKCWDVENEFKCIQTLPCHKGFITAIMMLSDGKLVSCSTDSKVKIFSESL